MSSNKPQQKDTGITAFWAWIGSMVSFSIMFYRFQNTKGTSLEMMALLLFIVVGVIAFLAMIASMFKGNSGKGRNDKKPNGKTVQINNRSFEHGIILAVLLVLLVPLSALAGPIIDKKFFNSNRPSPSPYVQTLPKPSIKPVVNQKSSNSAVSNKIDCTGPDGVVFKTTQKECDDFNTAWGNTDNKDNGDEYIKCNIHVNCGGGYKDMKRSACNDMVCCNITESDWKLLSKGECERQQQAEYSKENLEWCNSMKKYFTTDQYHDCLVNKN